MRDVSVGYPAGLQSGRVPDSEALMPPQGSHPPSRPSRVAAHRRQLIARPATSKTDLAINISGGRHPDQRLRQYAGFRICRSWRVAVQSLVANPSKNKRRRASSHQRRRKRCSATDARALCNSSSGQKPDRIGAFTALETSRVTAYQFQFRKIEV